MTFVNFVYDADQAALKGNWTPYFFSPWKALKSHQSGGGNMYFCE